MRKFILVIVGFCLCMMANAQTLVPIVWTAYGLVFDAPKGILVEEDTEDTFLLNNSRFYIVIHSLESNDMMKDELPELLKGLAVDDGVKELSEVNSFDLSQFYGFYLTGISETDSCYYAGLMTKDAGSAFCISILYNRTDAKVVEKILKSFKMQED